MIADIAKKIGYDSICFLDDNKTGDFCGYKIKGKTNSCNQFDCDFCVAIGDSEVRKDFICRLLLANKSLPVLIHPSAVVGENTEFGVGTVVMAGAVVNPCVQIGKGCIINTCASVDHDSIVSDFSHISVGAHLAGTVILGENVWIGAGATVSNNIGICSNVLVGAGAVVVKSIEDSGTYIGVPAKKIK